MGAVKLSVKPFVCQKSVGNFRDTSLHEITLYSNRYTCLKHEVGNHIRICSDGADSDDSFASICPALLSIFDSCIGYLRMDRNPSGNNFLRNPLGRGIAFFIGRQDTKREKAMDSLVKHTADLLPELENWAKQPLTLSEEHLFLQTRRHIMEGYKEIWNTLEGKKGIRTTESQYNALSDEILRQIEKAIGKKIEEILPKFEIEHLDWFVSDIRDFVEKRFFGNKSHTFVVVPDGSRYSIQSEKADGTTCRKYQIGTDENLQEIKEIMNNIQKDAQLEEKVKTLKILGNQLYPLRTVFEKEIGRLINNIKYATSDENRILLGRCDLCEALKKKWNID